MIRGTEHDDYRARRSTPRSVSGDGETEFGVSEDVGAIRCPHLLFYRVGCSGGPHHSHGGGLQAHLRYEYIPGLAGSVGVLRRVLLAGDSSRVHQSAVRIQGRSSDGPFACRGGRVCVLSGEQDHDVRSVPRCIVCDSRGLLDTGDFCQSIRPFAGSGRDRDTAAQLRASLQPRGHKHRCAAGRHPYPAEVGRAGEHGEFVPCGGTDDPRR